MYKRRHILACMLLLQFSNILPWLAWPHWQQQCQEPAGTTLADSVQAAGIHIWNAGGYTTLSHRLLAHTAASFMAWVAAGWLATFSVTPQPLPLAQNHGELFEQAFVSRAVSATTSSDSPCICCCRIYVNDAKQWQRRGALAGWTAAINQTEKSRDEC
jgi:hypothetical protein